MEAIFAGILASWKVSAVLGMIMIFAAIGVASLVVIAICLWPRSAPNRGAAPGAGEGRSGSGQVKNP